MGKSLTDVLASPGQITVTVGGSDSPAQVSEYYPTDQLWAIAAICLQTIEGAQIYNGRDGNQKFFISNRNPDRRPNRNAPPVEQVTAYKTGTVLFNNVAVVDRAKIGDAEIAGGQLLAHALGFVKLTKAELEAAQKAAGAKVPTAE